MQLEATTISNLHPVAIRVLWVHTATFPQEALPLVLCAPKVLMQVPWVTWLAEAVPMGHMAICLAQAIYRWLVFCVIKVHTTPSGRPHYAHLAIKVPT